MFKFSIIIPVFKEAGIINNSIKDILDKFRTEKFEIIVVDGENNGSTINTINTGYANIKKSISGKNRAKQMNAGASVSEGDVLLFLHADCALPENALDQIKNVFDSDPDTAAGAFNLKIDSNKIIFKIISKLSSLRARITKIPYGDQSIFIRKDYFLKLGGYRELPLMEDADLMRRIKKNKGKINILPAGVTASPRRWEKEGILYYTLKNWLITILYFLGAHPEKLKKLYYRGE
ncbi:MAG: TIGR04283 family arsenosugar biosynthesis glycosyltransferase [bacterium]